MMNLQIQNMQSIMKALMQVRKSCYHECMLVYMLEGERRKSKDENIDSSVHGIATSAATRIVKSACTMIEIPEVTSVFKRENVEGR